MEQKVRIESSDGVLIFGTLRTIENAKGLVVFVHGFAGHQNEHIFFNGSRYFAERGFDSFRFDFYGDATSTRSFRTSSLKAQANDLREVISNFRSSYSHIHVIGHSLGCPVILLCKLGNIDSMVFWDPSRQPNDVFSHIACTHGVCYIKARIDFVIDREVIEDARSFPRIPDLLQGTNVPIKIITAGNAGWKIGRNLYFSNANEPKAFFNIEESNHDFDENGAENQLFQETLSWIQRN